MIADRLAKLAFWLSLCVAAFVYGVAVVGLQIFPYDAVRATFITLGEIRQHATAKDVGAFLKFSEIERSNAASERIRPVRDAGADDGFLFFGGQFQFMEHCPQQGCLAVIYSRAGDLVEAYPYRPRDIFESNEATGFPYETIFFDFTRHSNPLGIERYANGDLLTVFQGRFVFPFGTGVARVDRDGRPVWFRWDYSHHWPTLNAEEQAIVPGTEIGDAPVAVKMPGWGFRLTCNSGHPYRDTLKVLDPDGGLRREISVLDALLASPYRAVLKQSTDPCDPTHLNYAQQVSDEVAARIDDVAAGDFLVSLRNVSAFGFIDGADGRLKRLVRGTFIQQHSVQHLRDAQFLMFDNLGADAEGGPSRLLLVDLSSGEETTIFPNARTPAAFRSTFSATGGHVTLSPDRRRAIIAVTRAGKAFEIRLSDGAVLTTFNNLHDVAAVDDLPDKRARFAGIFRTYGIDYVQMRRQVP